MVDRFRVFWKSLSREKNTFLALWQLTYTAIGFISTAFSFAVLVKNLIGYTGFESWCKDYWWALLSSGILASVVKNKEQTSFEGALENDDFRVNVRVSNLFSVGASSFVIPTNTFFRTKMDGEYISPDSVQGDFQLKYFKNRFDELDRLIEASLQEQNIAYENAHDKFGAVKKYPIGSVAKVDFGGKHYYFVAINDVNEFGKPEGQGYSNVEAALKGLRKTIEKIGHCDELAMPLIGTGRATIREATKDKVFQDIVDCFLNAENKISRKLIVCISPKDYLEGMINLKRVRKYLDYKGEFK